MLEGRWQLTVGCCTARNVSKQFPHSLFFQRSSSSDSSQSPSPCRPGPSQGRFRVRSHSNYTTTHPGYTIIAMCNRSAVRRTIFNPLFLPYCHLLICFGKGPKELLTCSKIFILDKTSSPSLTSQEQTLDFWCTARHTAWTASCKL